jgi:MFS family permease
MKRESSWIALRNPAFRKLWVASLLSGTCLAAHDTAATWMMNVLENFYWALPLMSVVASLPFFLVALPAGALADMISRKRLLSIMNLWLAAAAGGLAIASFFHLLNPYVLLAGVFLMALGFALTSPAWTAIQSEIVSKEELPSAAIMGGLQLSISGIIGPALGGFLIVWTTPAVVFASNACGFLLLIFAIAQLKLKKPPRNFALTDLFESFFKAVR